MTGANAEEIQRAWDRNLLPETMRIPNGMKDWSIVIQHRQDGFFEGYEASLAAGEIERDDLFEALSALLKRYKALADSGDCGFWNCEKEDEVIAARKALEKERPMVDTKFTDNLDIDQRLAHVVEECGEVLAAAGKCQRWGFKSVNPLLPPEQQETNIDWLKRELTDLRGAIERFERDCLVVQ